eukprot:jgi/Hompol1/6040/HPOL_004812-RA
MTPKGLEIRWARSAIWGVDREGSWPNKRELSGYPSKPEEVDAVVDAEVEAVVDADAEAEADGADRDALRSREGPAIEPAKKPKRPDESDASTGDGAVADAEVEAEEAIASDVAVKSSGSEEIGGKRPKKWMSWLLL